MRLPVAVVGLAVILECLGGVGGLLRLSGFHLWLIAGFVLLAAWVAQRDPWLGALAAYVAIRTGLTVGPGAFEMGMAKVLAAVAIVTLQQAPAWTVPLWRPAVTTLAGIHLAMMGIQAFGFDPLWLWTMPMPPGSTLHGLTGNSNYLGAFLALTVAFVPGWALPLLGLGVVGSKSALAALAFAAAVTVRYRDRWRIALPLAAGTLAAGVAWRGFDLTSWIYRASAWQAAVGRWDDTWATILLGFGPGWLWRTNLVVSMGGPPERFAHLHNDPLQFSLAFGLLGAGLLAGWLWSHRAAWRGPWGPALAALGIVSLGTFPFQVPATATLGIVILGLATRRTAWALNSPPSR